MFPDERECIFLRKLKTWKSGSFDFYMIFEIVHSFSLTSHFHDQRLYFLSYTSLCIIVHKINVRNM